jgi:SAM-dependent methyltransferase
VTALDDRVGAPALLLAVAGHGLTATATMLPDGPLDDREWAELVRLVVSERLEGHLAGAVADGSLPTTDSQAGEALARHIEVMGLALTLEQMLIEVADLLASAGIECRVLKGSAAAHLDYPDPSLRAFGDVDLLVRGDAFDDAVAALSADFRRRTPEPRPGFDRRFGKGAVLTGPDGLQIDLHRTFVMGPFGIAIDADELWQRSVPFGVGGRQLEALAAEERFLNACYHVVLGDVPPRLVPQRDIAQMLQTRTLDFDRIRMLSCHWQSDVVVAYALRMVWDNFALGDANAMSEWARSYRPSGRELGYLAAYTGPNSTYVTKSLAGVRAIHGVRLKVAYLLALGLPTRRFLRERGTTATARWKHGLDEAAINRGDG